MQEKRKEQRWPAFLGGRASSLDHQSTADCLIRNTSERGALLRVGRGQFFPDEFELIIPQRDAVFRARARWRGGEQVGVELRHAAAGADSPAPLSLMEQLRRIEKKNRQLKRRLAELSQ
jgi:hypothetical protein